MAKRKSAIGLLQEMAESKPVAKKKPLPPLERGAKTLRRQTTPRKSPRELKKESPIKKFGGYNRPEGEPNTYEETPTGTKPLGLSRPRKKIRKVA